MPSSYRPVIDGNDNVIGFDTFSPTGVLVRRFNTEEEADAHCVDMDTPYRTVFEKAPEPEAEPAPAAEPTVEPEPATPSTPGAPEQS